MTKFIAILLVLVLIGVSGYFAWDKYNSTNSMPKNIVAEIQSIELAKNQEKVAENKQVYKIKIRYVKRKGDQIIDHFAYIYTTHTFASENEVGYFISVVQIGNTFSAGHR